MNKWIFKYSKLIFLNSGFRTIKKFNSNNLFEFYLFEYFCFLQIAIIFLNFIYLNIFVFFKFPFFWHLSAVFLLFISVVKNDDDDAFTWFKIHPIILLIFSVFLIYRRLIHLVRRRFNKIFNYYSRRYLGLELLV